MKHAILLMMVAGVASATPIAQASGRGDHRSSRVDLQRSLRATLAVTNARAEAVTVFLDGRYGGHIAPGETWQRGLRPGAVAVEVRDPRGEVVAQTSRRLAAREWAELEVSAAPARLRIDNAAAVPLTVWVGSEIVAELAPGEHARVAVDAGPQRVRATYLQHGRSKQLASERRVFDEGSRESITFEPPATTLVSVSQRLDRRAQLTIDGAPGPWLEPGETRLVEVPVGTVALRFERYGRVLDARRVFAAPDRDAAWVAGSEPDRAARSAPQAAEADAVGWAWVDRARAVSGRALARPAPRDHHRHDDDDDDDDEECRSC